MNAVRLAVLRGGINGLPMTTRVPDNVEVGATIPPSDGYRGWRSPRVVGGGPSFPIGIILVEGGVLDKGAHTDDGLQDNTLESTSDGGKSSTRQGQDSRRGGFI